MGDRYELYEPCCYCGKHNNVWYAPTCGSYTFRCKSCGKTNFIRVGFQIIKAEDVTSKDCYEAFMDATNAFWNKHDIKRIKKECTETARSIRNSNKGNQVII